MLDTAKTYFMGIATDAIKEKKPSTCPYAIGDGVYFDRQLWHVKNWYRNENGVVIVEITRTVSGVEETKETTLKFLHE